MRYGFFHFFMSRMRSDCAESAGGITCSAATGSGGEAEFCCELHARITRVINSTGSSRQERTITTPRLPHHHDIIVLCRPHDYDNPANDAPSQEKVQEENCEQIPLAPRQCYERRQKVQQQRNA